MGRENQYPRWIWNLLYLHHRCYRLCRSWRCAIRLVLRQSWTTAAGIAVCNSSNWTGAAECVSFCKPPTNVSPKNPDTTFQWSQVEPISGSDYFSPTNVLPYAQQFELSLERQLGSNTVASVSYVGAVGRHNLTFLEANPGNSSLCLYLSNPANEYKNTGTCGPGGEQNQYIEADGTVVNSTRTRFGTNFGATPVIPSSGQFQLQLFLPGKCATHGGYWNFLIGYTWSKSMDNGSGVFDPTNVFNPSASRALSTFDVPQNLVISYTVQFAVRLAHRQK